MASYNNNYQRNPHRGGADRQGQSAEVSYNHILSRFNPEWITKAIDAEGVQFCDNVASKLKEVSASYVRNIFGELKRIETKGFENCRTDFFLLRPKVAYSTARNDKDKIANLFKEVYNKMADNVNDTLTFTNLVRMTEAIIAYHRTYTNK